ERTSGVERRLPGEQIARGHAERSAGVRIPPVLRFGAGEGTLLDAIPACPGVRRRLGAGSRAPHPERTEEGIAQEIPVTPPRGSLDQQTREVIRRVAVAPFAPRRCVRRG